MWSFWEAQGLDGLDFSHWNLFQQWSCLHFMSHKHKKSSYLQPEAMEKNLLAWKIWDGYSIAPA